MWKTEDEFDENRFKEIIDSTEDELVEDDQKLINIMNDLMHDSIESEDVEYKNMLIRFDDSLWNLKRSTANKLTELREVRSGS